MVRFLEHVRPHFCVLTYVISKGDLGDMIRGGVCFTRRRE